jgi:hypothetical protein
MTSDMPEQIPQPPPVATPDPPGAAYRDDEQWRNPAPATLPKFTGLDREFDGAAVTLPRPLAGASVYEIWVFALWALLAVCAAMAGAPLAQAEPGQADLSEPFAVAGGPFVGQWGAHGEGLTINADGSAVEITRSGTVTFHLTSVQGPPSQPDTTAYGNLPDGGYATATLVDGGRGLTLSVANGDNAFPFCKKVGGSYVNSDDCGA